VPVITAVALWLSACSSSSNSPAAIGPSCLDAPAACPTGQTCWPVDSALHFACITSQQSANFASSCDDTIGVATCYDGQTCDSTTAGMPGKCTLFCDPTTGPMCPNGYSCFATHVGGASGPALQLCRSNTGAPPNDAGLPGDGGLMGFDSGGPPMTFDGGGGDGGPVQM